VQRGLAAGAVERPTQDLAVNGDNTLALLREPRRETLERRLELVRVKLAKQAAERVVARRAVRKLQEAAQKLLPLPGKPHHVHRTLAAAQRYHEHLMKVVQTGVAAPRVVQIVPTRSKRL